MNIERAMALASYPGSRGYKATMAPEYTHMILSLPLSLLLEMHGGLGDLHQHHVCSLQQASVLPDS